MAEPAIRYDQQIDTASGLAVHPPTTEASIREKDVEHRLPVDLDRLESACAGLEEELAMIRDALEPVSMTPETPTLPGPEGAAPSRPMSPAAERVLNATRRVNAARYALRSIRARLDLPDVEPPF